MSAGQAIYCVLPQTLITPGVPVANKPITSGPRADSGQYFFSASTDEVTGTAQTHFSLGEETITSRGAPDQEQILLVRSRGRRWEDLSLGLHSAEQRTLDDFDGTVVNKADFWLQAAQTGASLMGQLMTGSSIRQVTLTARGDGPDDERKSFSGFEKRICSGFVCVDRPWAEANAGATDSGNLEKWWPGHGGTGANLACRSLS